MIDARYIARKVKAKGHKMNEIAERLGTQYQNLYKSLNNSNLNTVQRIAEAANMHPIELLLPPEGFTHFYDEITGDWLGIRKK